MARHLAPFSCRQTIADSVRRRSFGCVLPLGRHASTNGSKLIQCASDSIALSSFQEGQNARHHNRFKREQALVSKRVWPGSGTSMTKLARSRVGKAHVTLRGLHNRASAAHSVEWLNHRSHTGH